MGGLDIKRLYLELERQVRSGQAEERGKEFLENKDNHRHTLGSRTIMVGSKEAGVQPQECEHAANRGLPQQR